MKNERRTERIWAVSLMIISIISLISGGINLAGVELPHTIKLAIAMIQIIAGIALIAATVIKFKNMKNR